MSGFISKGTKLSYKAGTGSTYTALTDLIEYPDMGGDVDSIEITTLDDGAHVYMNGLDDYGENLSFKFLYKPTQFATLSGLTGTISWKLELPDGTDGALDTAITWDGECHCKLLGKTYNEALEYELDIKPSSAMAIA